MSLARKPEGVTDIVDRISDAFYALDKEWIFTYVNTQGEKFLNRSRKTLLGKSLWEAFPQLVNRKSYKKLHQAMRTQKTTRYQEFSPLLQKWIEISAYPSKEGLSVLFKDITERKQLEAELKLSRDQLRAILDNIADSITVQDATGNMLYANKAAVKSIGYSSARAMVQAPLLDYINKFELYDETGKPFLPDRLPGRRAIAGEKNPKVLVKYLHKESGKVQWAIIKSTAIYDKQKKPQFVINIVEDITEQKMLTQKKDEFISMVSHELKTPLTSMRLFLELLDKELDKTSNEKAKNYIERVLAQSNKLKDLVDDLLDVSRIQTGKLRYRKEVFSLDDLIKETVAIHRPLATHHRLSLVNKVAVAVEGDRLRIAQVISNLLTNAIKYSPAADSIIVRMKQQRGMVTVSVKDFGIGISKEDQKKIFEKLYQATNSIEKTFPGLGMGLYISKEIMRWHKGTIWVKSVKHKGSTFYFSLPIYTKS